MISSVDGLYDELGGTSEAAKIAGVGAPAASNWKAEGTIPAEYFAVFSDAVAGRGKEVDRAIFRFRAVPTEAPQ